MVRGKVLIIFGIMASSAILAQVLRPTAYMAEETPIVPLTEAVPKTFADWKEIPSNFHEVVDPTQREVMEKIYSQTLTRTYANRDGYMIMLSIAYGKSQRDGVEMHKPEVCYPAQGFVVTGKESLNENIGDFSKSLKLNRMVGRKGPRNEPITYWTLVGGKVVNSRYEKKLAELSYAAKNQIPDGLLVRISSIDENSTRAYSMQIKFAKDLYGNLLAKERSQLFGNFL